MKKRTLIVTGGVLLAAAILSFAVLRKRYSPTETTTVTRGDLVESVYGLGTVTANQSYQLKVGVTTEVKNLYVREGDSVEKGTALIRLGEGDNVFRAPFKGTVTALPFKEKEAVFPQIPILTLINLLDRYLVISLEQEGALRVRTGQPARVAFETIRGKTFQGTVRSLYPNDGQFLVRIDVPSLPPEILPGMTGDVAIEVARRHDVPLVPVRAIQSNHVLVRDGKSTRKVAVVLGAVDGKSAEIAEGPLKPGDEVVLLKE